MGDKKKREIVRLQRLQAALEKRTEGLDDAIKGKSKELGDMEYMRIMKIRSMRKIDEGISLLKHDAPTKPTMNAKRTQTDEGRLGIGYLFPSSRGNPQSTERKVDDTAPFFPSPPFSTFCLIAMAMKKYSHQGQGHSLREIVNFIVTNFPGFFNSKSHDSLKYSLLSGHPFKQFRDNTFGLKSEETAKLYQKVLHVMRHSRKIVMASMRYPGRAHSLITGWLTDYPISEITEEPVEDPLQIDSNDNIASLATESEDFLKIEEVVHLADDVEVYMADGEEVHLEDSEGVDLEDSEEVHLEDTEEACSEDNEEVPFADREEVQLANHENVHSVDDGVVPLANDNQPVIKVEFSISEECQDVYEETWQSEDMETS